MTLIMEMCRRKPLPEYTKVDYRSRKVVFFSLEEEQLDQQHDEIHHNKKCMEHNDFNDMPQLEEANDGDVSVTVTLNYIYRTRPVTIHRLMWSTTIVTMKHKCMKVCNT